MCFEILIVASHGNGMEMREIVCIFVANAFVPNAKLFLPSSKANNGMTVITSFAGSCPPFTVLPNRAEPQKKHAFLFHRAVIYR